MHFDRAARQSYRQTVTVLSLADLAASTPPGTPWLGLTLPFPLYGIFRYLYLVHRRSQGGSPTELLLADRPLLLCVAFWGATTIALIYHPWTLAR